MASSEMTPFAKTGGLGDVLGSLPYALLKRGHEISVFIPFYRIETADSPEVILQETLMLGDRPATFSVVRISKERGVHLYAIRKDEYFDRSCLYGTPDHDYDDNAKRFIFFCKAVVHSISALGLNAQLIHAHDWQTALIPIYLNFQGAKAPSRRPSTVLTIHNIAYQGLFDSRDFRFTNLPNHIFDSKGLEFYGKMNLLKGGIVYADAVTTVSPRYAEEVQTAEYGYGLDGVLRSRSAPIQGILNGVDYATWNPSSDPLLPHRYEKSKMDGKLVCKQHLATHFGLKQSNEPILGMVTRFAHQKGIDLLMDSVPHLIRKGMRIAILGNGDALYESRLRELAAKHSTQIGLKIGFDEKLAHLIYAGSDFFLMPSLYEPCGLSQLYALRYGCIPIVRATGGLDDTVTQWDPKTSQGTGFKFRKPETREFLDAIGQAVQVYQKTEEIRTLRQNAMEVDFSWENMALEYENLYQSLQHA